MKTILFKTIIIAFFVGTAVSCSDEDENRFRPGSTHEKAMMIVLKRIVFMVQ